jgi:hypothetical protein
MRTGTDRTTTPFGAGSIVAEVLEGVDLSGKRMVVTAAGIAETTGTTRACTWRPST